MPRNENLGDSLIAIPLVTRVVGLVWRNRWDSEELECQSVAQQWVDQFRREEPEELDRRLIAYGAYLLALRTVYGLPRQPRTPWRPVLCSRTLHVWINMWRLVTKAQRQRRILRLVTRNLHRDRRIALARARALGPRQWTTGTHPFYCGPVGGTVPLRYVYVREEYGKVGRI